MIDPPFPLPDLQGARWNGSPFSLADAPGRLVIVFFGYTQCPDVCPLTLARLASLEKRLGDRADEVSVVFVSVDPDRDTPAALKEYVEGFHPGFYGVQLSPEALAEVVRGWGLAVQKGEPQADADGWYAINHTGAIYVLGPDRALRLRFSQDEGVDEMLPDILALLDAVGAKKG